MKAYLLLVHAITWKILIFIVPEILAKFRNNKIPLEKYENKNPNFIEGINCPKSHLFLGNNVHNK